MKYINSVEIFSCVLLCVIIILKSAKKKKLNIDVNIDEMPHVDVNIHTQAYK